MLLLIFTLHYLSQIFAKSMRSGQPPSPHSGEQSRLRVLKACSTSMQILFEIIMITEDTADDMSKERQRHPHYQPDFSSPDSLPSLKPVVIYWRTFCQHSSFPLKLLPRHMYQSWILESLQFLLHSGSQAVEQNPTDKSSTGLVSVFYRPWHSHARKVTLSPSWIHSQSWLAETSGSCSEIFLFTPCTSLFPYRSTRTQNYVIAYSCLPEFQNQPLSW